MRNSRKINKSISKFNLNYLPSFLLYCSLLEKIRRQSVGKAPNKRISLFILSFTRSAWFTPRRDSPCDHRGVSTSCTRNPWPTSTHIMAPLLVILDQFGLSLKSRSVAVRSHQERAMLSEPCSFTSIRFARKHMQELHCWK